MRHDRSRDGKDCKHFSSTRENSQGDDGQRVVADKLNNTPELTHKGKALSKHGHIDLHQGLYVRQASPHSKQSSSFLLRLWEEN